LVRTIVSELFGGLPMTMTDTVCWAAMERVQPIKSRTMAAIRSTPSLYAIAA
jgi:hypothetical protein